MAALKLYYGTLANYTALATKDSDALYFITDEKKVYKGSTDFSDSVRFVASMPANPLQGVIYIDASAGGAAKAYNGTSVVAIGTPTSTTISSSSTDGTVPTSKTVYDYIDGLNLPTTYAPINNPTFTGTVTLPAPSSDSDDTTAATTAWVRTKISGAVAGAFHFMGVVANEAALAAIQNPSQGDVYQVTTTSSGSNGEFAYDGTNWVELGTVLDLSAYYTSSQTDSAISNAIAAAASDYDAAGAADTAEQNAKDYADSLASNYDAAGAATTAENNAKSYADSLAVNYDAAGAAAAAQTAAESYADTAIATALTWTQIPAAQAGE